MILFIKLSKYILYFDRNNVPIITKKQTQKYIILEFLNLKLDLILSPIKYIASILYINTSNNNCITSILSILEFSPNKDTCFNTWKAAYSYKEDSSYPNTAIVWNTKSVKIENYPILKVPSLDTPIKKKNYKFLWYFLILGLSILSFGIDVNNNIGVILKA